MAGVLCSMVGASFVTAVAEVIRKKVGIAAVNQTQISTSQSQFGGASAVFDGNDDYLTLTGLPSTANSDFTWECWARFDILPWNQTLGGGSYMMLNTGGSGDYFLIARNGAGSQVQLSIATGGNKYGSWTKTGVNLSINTWYHIAYVRSSGVWKTFFNGTELTTFINDSNFTNSGRTEDMSYATIGRFIDSRGSMDGFLDEIRVSKSARYSADFTPSTSAFVNDDNTLLLIHCNGTNASTYFEDDNGVRAPKGILANANASISTTQSKFGGTSAFFDGTLDYLDVFPGNAFGTGDFTIEAWIYPTSVTGVKVIYDDRQTSTDASKILFYMNGTSIYYYSTGNHITGTISTANTWYHVAVSRSSGTVRMFVNGTQAGSNFTDTNSKTVNSTNDFLIGQNCETASRTADQEFIGYMDEFRISNSARYTTNFTAPTAPFVNDSNTLLLLHMDGTNGSTVFRDDNGARAPKGIQAFGNAQIDTAQSKFNGSSLLLDGTGDYLAINDPENNFLFGTNNLTIEFWIRLNVTTAQIIWDQRSVGDNETRPTIYYNAGGFKVYNNGSDLLLTTATISTGVWYHLAYTRSGNSHYLFLDGTQQGSTVTNSVSWGSRSDIILGARSYDKALGVNGWIDELRVSNTARYTSNFTAPTAPFQNDANTLLLMHMDGTDAVTVFVDDNGKTPT